MLGNSRMMITKFTFMTLAVSTCLLAPGKTAWAEEYLNGIEWQAPPIVTPGRTDSDPPSDAIVLFDGSDLSKWHNG